MADVICLSESDSDVQEEDDPTLPSREECEARCQMFAEITGTDTALAMFYLQDREWIVERAINDYFAESGGSDPAPSKANHVAEPATSKASSSTVLSLATGPDTSRAKPSQEPKNTYLTTHPPMLQPRNDSRIRILSWNIDGLDPDNLQSRTEGACSVLLQERPEVIFLQEVIDHSLKIIQERCSEVYQVFPGADKDSLTPGDYFTAMLLQKKHVSVETVMLADFPTSLMQRNLLEVQCKVKGIPMALLTSHLESTAEHSQERRKQLTVAFDRMTQIPSDRSVVFGGDLNLREKDLKGTSAKPAQVQDLWEVTGKRPEAKFTWDLFINDNKQMHGKYQPRCRFDRLYFRPAQEAQVQPVYFELVGIQRLAACHRFPSDHWGILAHFDVV